MPVRVADLTPLFAFVTLAASFLTGCGLRCGGDVYADDDRLPGHELTVRELSHALGQEQSLNVLWDYESMFPAEDTRKRPFEFPPYPYAQLDRLTVRIILKGDFKEFVYESEDGTCDDKPSIQAPARAILSSEHGDLDAEFDIAVIPSNVGVNNARITDPSGRLADYLNGLDLPEGAVREFSVHVDYDERGVLEYAALQADVGFVNQRFSRIIAAGSRGQFED